MNFRKTNTYLQDLQIVTGSCAQILTRWTYAPSLEHSESQFVSLYFKYDKMQRLVQVTIDISTARAILSFKHLVASTEMPILKIIRLAELFQQNEWFCIQSAAFRRSMRQLAQVRPISMSQTQYWL